jgi:hypothetical protein
MVVRLPDFSIMVLPVSTLRGEEMLSELGGRGMFLERGPEARTEVAAMAEITRSVDKRIVFIGFFAVPGFKRKSPLVAPHQPYTATAKITHRSPLIISPHSRAGVVTICVQTRQAVPAKTAVPDGTTAMVNSEV